MGACQVERKYLVGYSEQVLLQSYTVFVILMYIAYMDIHGLLKRILFFFTAQ